MATLLSLISGINAQTVLEGETNGELIEESKPVIDTANSNLFSEKETEKQLKRRVGIELKYPFIHGGDKNFPDFWNIAWNGIFDLSVDLNNIVIKNLAISPMIDISLYKVDGISLHENAFLMLVTAFSAKYDLLLPPRKLIVFTPIINIGLSTNCFYLTYGNKGEWTSDLGFICSFGSAIKIRLSNGFEIGPVVYYDFTRRFYYISEGEPIEKDEWIENINNFKIGIKANIPIVSNNK